ncbi:hypothetical protein DH2020_025025 [Rehmannia glutinosa]|uniref:Cytochrome b561 domain-containing protein n=1 Tax=Rehmannia glutinosa TaxID=99300 RepID=A0ABR0W3A8_REHGL
MLFADLIKFPSPGIKTGETSISLFVSHLPIKYQLQPKNGQVFQDSHHHFHIFLHHRPLPFIFIRTELLGLQIPQQQHLCGVQHSSVPKLIPPLELPPIHPHRRYRVPPHTDHRLRLGRLVTQPHRRRRVLRHDWSAVFGCFPQLNRPCPRLHLPDFRHATRLQEGPLSFRVPRIGAEFANDEMIIYATIELPSDRTSFTHVWQNGHVSGDTPLIHPTDGENMRSFGTIDFATGQTAETGTASGGSRNRKRNVHGVINVVSWGILLPVGAMAARYLKVFKSANPAWFYLHVTCQTSAYVVGVAGWATGLKLGSDSPGVEHTTHRNIGITIFALATLQVFAMFLRPKPDHKYRTYWNIYHQTIGYSVIVLSIVNIFEGIDILDPEKKWKKAYTGVLIFLGAIAAVLEAFTWYVVIKRKGQSTNNGYGA